MPASLQQALAKAVELLESGGVVGFPTDTLYGLGADAFDVRAVSRVYSIKGRPRHMGMPLLLGKVDDVERVALDVPDLARTLMERFWPGPLTLILKRSLEIPSEVTGGRDSVAVRMPDHPVPLALVNGLGRPITGTSANPTGGSDPITAEDVRRLLGSKVDYVVDGGSAISGRGSTILDLTDTRPRLVREGAVVYESLRDVIDVALGTSSSWEEWCCE